MFTYMWVYQVVPDCHLLESFSDTDRWPCRMEVAVCARMMDNVPGDMSYGYGRYGPLLYFAQTERLVEESFRWKTVFVF